MNNKEKEIAIEKVNEVYNLVNKQLRIIIDKRMTMIIGLGIAAIPIIEMFFSSYLDPFFIKNNFSSVIIYILRSIFYWSFFGLLSKFDKRKNEHKNFLAEKIEKIGIALSIFCFTTATVLAFSGYAKLISPILLIMIGFMHLVQGLFSEKIFVYLGWLYFLVGILGIYLSSYNLWMNLLLFQGFSLFLVGLFKKN